MNIEYINTATVSDYNNLRASVGWIAISEKQAQAGIDNSAYLVSAVVDNKTVGMARLITDGGYVKYIADVMVLPEYQRQNIGKTMMNMVMSYINCNLNIGDCAYVVLMAAKGKENFYKQFGFEERPNDNVGAGMTQLISK